MVLFEVLHTRTNKDTIPNLREHRCSLTAPSVLHWAQPHSRVSHCAITALAATSKETYYLVK